ncbi:hypothetical protein [Aeromicrobium chenweiae]|uniref:Uncharacterized protein n=1 Tax=Aeromicrobium chenweiae TaxID=2079793 RepID=A0A2S0WR76_9ACTN|nr:hypothetical protein [Aeromicrobium chenweiae]AWB93812.1 hypothetical protein C3E78_17225 [Aeromicrobium chenweiae]TGN30857.1 hypothetical protein E4L97_14640 [Aeromicrobium chenweiae]
MRLTNPLWYLAAFLLAIGSTMAATAFAASAFDDIRGATLTPVSELVDAKGKTLAVFSNDPDRGDIACHARDRAKQRVEIPDKDVGVTAQSAGETWYLIGLLEDGRDGLRVVCRPESNRPDTAGYAHAAVSTYAGTVNNAKGVAVLGVTAGGALGAYVFWCRRSARRNRALVGTATGGSPQ